MEIYKSPVPPRAFRVLGTLDVIMAFAMGAKGDPVGFVSLGLALFCFVLAEILERMEKPHG